MVKPSFNELAKVCIQLVATNYSVAMSASARHGNASLTEQRDALLNFHCIASDELGFLHELLKEKAGPFHWLNLIIDNRNTPQNDQNGDTELKT
jgi:hypothetical protein